MSAFELVDASLVYVKALAPFALVFTAVAMAEQLIGLIQKSIPSKKMKW